MERLLLGKFPKVSVTGLERFPTFLIDHRGPSYVFLDEGQAGDELELPAVVTRLAIVDSLVANSYISSLKKHTDYGGLLYLAPNTPFDEFNQIIIVDRIEDKDVLTETGTIEAIAIRQRAYKESLDPLFLSAWQLPNLTNI